MVQRTLAASGYVSCRWPMEHPTITTLARPFARGALAVGWLALPRPAHQNAVESHTDQDRDNDHEDQRAVGATDDPVDIHVAQIDKRKGEPQPSEDYAGDQTWSLAKWRRRVLAVLFGKEVRIALHSTKHYCT